MTSAAWVQWVRAAALGTAGGLAIGLAGAPTEWSAFAFLGPAFLLLAIVPPEGSPSPCGALIAGVCCGFAVNAWTMRWAIELFEVYASFPRIASVPVAVLLWLGQSVPFAVAAWTSAPLVTRGVPGWIALPGALTVAGSLVPMLFPWRIGVSQIPALFYPQCADLGGPPLVDLALALASCGTLEALRSANRGAAVASALALALPLGYGALRIEEVRAGRETAPLLRVGVVQASIGLFEQRTGAHHETQLALHRTATRELEARGADIVLWPESAYPYPIERGLPREEIAVRQNVLAEGVRGPVLFGALTFTREHRFNSVVALAETGRFIGIYDKVHLLAFGEYVPLWDYLPEQRYFGRGLTAGAHASAIEVAGARIGILNCYEDLLVEHARRTAALDPGFLANFTNDAWFGDTAAPYLHHMLARMRAIETRRDLVRAVNTGVSAHVLATGEDRHRTRPFERTSFLVDVRLLRGSTPWVRFGDLVTPALLGAWLGWLAATRRQTRAARSRLSPWHPARRTSPRGRERAR